MPVEAYYPRAGRMRNWVHDSSQVQVRQGKHWRQPDHGRPGQGGGCSAITVSRALRDSPLVNAQTRARIHEIAQQYGYAFNISARNLRLRRSMTVAVVVEMKPSLERQKSAPIRWTCWAASRRNSPRPAAVKEGLNSSSGG